MKRLTEVKMVKRVKVRRIGIKDVKNVKRVKVVVDVKVIGGEKDGIGVIVEIKVRKDVNEGE